MNPLSQKQTEFLRAEHPYSVYMHVAPNGKKYIGITKRSPESRWKQGYGNNEYFTRAIEKYGWNNIEHTVLFDGVSATFAHGAEIYLISHHKTHDREHGYNIAHGGIGGCAGYHHTEDAKRRISKAMSTRIVSEETRQKIRDANIGIKRSEEYCKRLSEAKKGKHTGEKASCWGRFGNLHHNSKAVNQIDAETLEVINVFGSAAEAAREMTGKSNTAHICDVCNGKRRFAHGYYWKYADDDSELRAPPRKEVETRKIRQYSKSGEYIAEFISIASAVRNNGLSDTTKSNISQCLKGKVKTAGGFRWEHG